MTFRRSSNCKLHETASSKVWCNRAAFIAQHACAEHVLRSVNTAKPDLSASCVWLRHTVEQSTPSAELARQNARLDLASSHYRAEHALHAHPLKASLGERGKLSVWYVRIPYIHSASICAKCNHLNNQGCNVALHFNKDLKTVRKETRLAGQKG